MKDFSAHKVVGQTSTVTFYIAESDPDILIIVPRKGTLESPKDAQENVAFMYDYASSTGRPCGCVVIMANVLSQAPEGRRAYAAIDPQRVYAAGLVVEDALSRALGSFFMGLSRPVAPTRLFDTMDKAVDWLRIQRPWHS